MTTLSAIVAIVVVVPAAAVLQGTHTDPHGGYDATTDSCLRCHDMHEAPGTPLIAGTTEKETCYQCHDGTGASTDIRSEFGEATIGASTQSSYHPLPHPIDGYSVKCGDCHTPHNSRDEFTKLLRINDGAGGWIYSPIDTPIGNTYCYRCHGTASPFPDPFADHTSFEGGVHQLLGGSPPSGSGIQCLNCHTPHGSAYPGLSQQEATCFTCHNAATPNTNPDLPFDTTELEYAFSAGVNDYDTTDADGLIRIYHHPIGDTEQDGGNRQVECASCHNSHLAGRDYSPTTSKLIDPGDTRVEWLVTWNVAENYNEGNISDWCVKCHAGPTVTAPFDAGTWIPYDIRLVDDSAVLNGGGNPHDTFEPEWYFTSPDSVHGEGGNLQCAACHDPHGSSNAYMLREIVRSPWTGNVNPTTTGFDGTIATKDHLREFCIGCHDDENVHNPSRLCTACHFHGARDRF